MTKDIEETRRVHAQMRQVEELTDTLVEATKGVPPHIALSGLMSCLARLMGVSNTPLDVVTQGLAGLIEMRERQEE